MHLPLATEQRAKVEAFQRRHRTAVLTLFFTDIVGSVQLKQDLGDSKAITLIQNHHELLRKLLCRFPEAEEVLQAGDSFFIVFVRPSDAVRFALLLQSRLRSVEQEHGRPVLDRIGIHLGEVVVQEHENSTKSKDLYGIQVDTAARVMSLAEGNQILLTRAAFDNARPVLKGEDLEGIDTLSWMNHGPYLLKGVEEPLEICEVGETNRAILKPPPDSEKVHRYFSPDSEPVLGWRPALGQVVPNTQWLLEAKLGEGGFGEVWVARNPKLQERRVFKFCFRADRVRSLKRELALFQILKKSVGSHPNIVGVQDVYFDQPPYYLVMDYGEGKDLQAWCEAQGGAYKVPLATRLEIVAQVADALQAAHNAGIIHRDVKPSNILVSALPRTQPLVAARLNEGGPTSNPQPTAKLTDFGIGQVVSDEVLAGMTRAGFSRPATMTNSPGSGTLMYMAPELLAGKPATIRSDIYSLGVVLFQLVAGNFTKPITPDWAREVQDPLLRQDLGKCFAGDPQQRFTGAGELALRLRNLEQRQQAGAEQRFRNLEQRQQEVAEQKAALTARERAAYRRGVRRTAILAAGVLIGVAGLALYAVSHVRREEREKAQAESAATEKERTLAREWLERKELADTLRQKAALLQQRGQLVEAEALYREALGLSKKAWPNGATEFETCIYGLADLLRGQGKQAQVEQLLSELIPPTMQGRPESLGILRWRGNFQAAHGRWKEAASDYAKAVALDPNDHWNYLLLAPLLIQVEDYSGYDKLREATLAHFETTGNPAIAERAAKILSLITTDGPGLERVGKLAEMGVAADPNEPWRQNTKGMAEYRQGHFASAIEWAQRVNTAGKSPPREAQSQFVLALSFHQLGRAEQARAALAKGIEIVQAKLPHLDNPDVASGWHEVLMAHIWMREAKALIVATDLSGEAQTELHHVSVAKTQQVSDAAKQAQPEQPTKIRSAPASLAWTEKKNLTNELGMEFVWISKLSGGGAFFGRYEVTQKQFRMIMGDLPPDQAVQGDDFPVANVTADEAKDFCDHLSKKEGKRYALPSRNDWLAATGILPEQEKDAWALVRDKGLLEHEVTSWRIRPLKQPAPVGSRGAQANGLSDIFGNVREWVASNESAGFSFDSEGFGERKALFVTGNKWKAITGFRCVVRDTD